MGYYHRYTDRDLNGIKGWLVIVAIGVFITPIRMTYELFPYFSTLFENDFLREITNKASSSYNPLLSAVIVGEGITNILMLCGSLYVARLFMTKNYLFPRAFIIFTLAVVAIVPLDGWMIHSLLPQIPVFDNETENSFMRTLVSAFIWIPYMLKSRRVECTFIEGRKEDEFATESSQEVTT